PAGKTESASAAPEAAGRAVASAPPPSTGSSAGASRTTRPPGPRPAGTPAISASEPEAQQEKDWIDNRWSRTDVGQFLASTLRLPNGTVTRALSVRVGDRDEASVCFDTANLNLRAGWTGGFLKFDAARFGLLNRPKIAGEIQFVTPDGPGWIGATGRFSGFHVRGKHVVLEYKIGDTIVRESPSVDQIDGHCVLMRTFEISPGETPLTLRLVAGSAATRSKPVSVANEPRALEVVWHGQPLVGGITHPSDASVRIDDQQIIVTF